MIIKFSKKVSHKESYITSEDFNSRTSSFQHWKERKIVFQDHIVRKFTSIMETTYFIQIYVPSTPQKTDKKHVFKFSNFKKSYLAKTSVLELLVFSIGKSVKLFFRII